MSHQMLPCNKVGSHTEQLKSFVMLPHFIMKVEACTSFPKSLWADFYPRAWRSQFYLHLYTSEIS